MDFRGDRQLNQLPPREIKGFKAQVDPLFSRFQATANGLLCNGLSRMPPARASQLHVAAAKLKDPGACQGSAASFPSAVRICGPRQFLRRIRRWWLDGKTGDEQFDPEVALAQRGEYLCYEALNFAERKSEMSSK